MELTSDASLRLAQICRVGYADRDDLLALVDAAPQLFVDPRTAIAASARRVSLEEFEALLRR